MRWQLCRSAYKIGKRRSIIRKDGKKLKILAAARHRFCTPKYSVVVEFQKPVVARDDRPFAHTPHVCGQMAPKKKQPASNQRQKLKSSSASSSVATAAPHL